MSFSVIVVPADVPEMEDINKIFEVAGVNHGNEYNEMTGEKTGRLWAEGSKMEACEIQEKILIPIAPYLASGTAILLPDEGPFDPTEPVSFAFDKAKGWNRRRLFLARNTKDVLRQKYILPACRKMVRFVEGLF